MEIHWAPFLNTGKKGGNREGSKRGPFIKMNRIFTHCEAGFVGNPQEIHLGMPEQGNSWLKKILFFNSCVGSQKNIGAYYRTVPVLSIETIQQILVIRPDGAWIFNNHPINKIQHFFRGGLG